MPFIPNCSFLELSAAWLDLSCFGSAKLLGSPASRASCGVAGSGSGHGLLAAALLS